eukprot:CAMPEP_0115320300 /NCGR_PEP_ID=MMETSP0270-20121206/80246_1 /TAXON_ID=71861 /ORGANISM="Scrippsiella trochoidea, Strain CCMP3099" /LENGTH=99 /DNA_ID=CAMNT_0002740091 /DNA_START=18 /DNA_END=317 /DNA_ORIENTATION=+
MPRILALAQAHIIESVWHIHAVIEHILARPEQVQHRAVVHEELERPRDQHPVGPKEAVIADRMRLQELAQHFLQLCKLICDVLPTRLCNHGPLTSSKHL